MAIRSLSTSSIATGSKRSKFNDGIAGKTYESIATYKVTGSATSSITFSNIPQDYKHLEVRYLVRNDTAAYFVRAQFNGDTGTTYTNKFMTSNGDDNQSTGDVGSYFPRSNTSTSLSTGVAIIHDYTSTSKYKGIRSIGGFTRFDGSEYYQDIIQSSWNSTAAITSITFNFLVGSYSPGTRISLYGIRG